MTVADPLMLEYEQAMDRVLVLRRQLNARSVASQPVERPQTPDEPLYGIRMPLFGDPALPWRFWDKVERRSGCWIWTASDTRRYGRFGVPGRGMVRAHKYAYETLVGPVAVDLQLDHICRNRPCVNPSHLEQVTSTENNRRAIAAA